MPDRLGPYRLLDRIGEGGMGVVYLARDPEQRSVAVKVLRPGVAGDPNARRRLAREVETMRLVRSPFVAEVLDTDVTGDTPYIVTRYVPGRTLDQVVSESGPLGGGALVRLAHGLAEALAAIHAAGVVHRDLKPGNVMLVNGNPVVIDFGIAQVLDSTRLTMTGMFMGTPGYLSPEVIEGQPSTSASDVHAWAATVAFAATGRPPFGTGSYETIFYRIVNGQPDLAGLPGPVADLLAPALNRDPARRPAAAQLGARAAALDVRALELFPVPGPRGAPMSAPGTRAEAPTRQPSLDAFARGSALAGPASPAGRPRTQPIGGPIRASDFADVLPPVSYAPSGYGATGYDASSYAPNGYAPNGYSPNGYAPDARPPGDLARAADRDGPWAGDGRAVRRPQPLLVLAAMVIAISVAVILPVAGTALALAFIVLLRAAGLAQRRAAERGAFLTVASFPFFLVRSAIATVAMAPFAVTAAVLAAGASLIAIPGDSLARALSFAAGGLVAFYGLGPGSGKARQQLSRVFAGVVRSRGVQFVALLGLGALAVAAVTTAITSPAAFWPLLPPTGTLVHLPSWQGIVGGMRIPFGPLRP